MVTIVLRIVRSVARTGTAACFLALGAITVNATGAEIDVQNDSLIDGNNGTPCACFVPGEQVAAWLDSPCDGEIVAVQIHWASVFGGAPTVTEQGIHIYDGSSFPTHAETLLQNAGAVPATIPGPSLVDGQLNEFRFLDPPTNAVPLSVSVSAGETFIVALEVLNQNAGGSPLIPSTVYDLDGCQTGRNGVKALPGGWTDACLVGVTGDWMIRAVVQCPVGDVPTVSEWGVVAMTLVLLTAATLVLCRPWRPAEA